MVARKSHMAHTEKGEDRKRRNQPSDHRDTTIQQAPKQRQHVSRVALLLSLASFDQLFVAHEESARMALI